MSEQNDIVVGGADMSEHQKNAQLQGETIIGKFLRSYKEKSPEKSDAVWLDEEFGKYPEIWANDKERKVVASSVVSAVSDFNKSNDGLQKQRAEGHSRERFLEMVINTSGVAYGANNVAQYAGCIDESIWRANEAMLDCVFCHNQDGSINFDKINQNPNLDGFIAEHHHAGTFNIDAAVRESGYKAEVLGSNAKNSVDIQIYDVNGKVVRRYQSKYGFDAEHTDNLFGNKYRGQQKLTPEEQVEHVSGAKDHIEAPDGTRSTGLSKAEAKDMQQNAQDEFCPRPPQYDWKYAQFGQICKTIGKKALFAGALTIGFQGVRILARRFWNSVTGQENQSVAEDIREFVESAVTSGAGTFGTVAVAGGLVVACRKGLLGAFMKSVRANAITNAVCVAVENIKILCKLGSGELSVENALDMAGNVNCALAGSILGAAKFGAVGAACGVVMGPVGIAVGGFLGGMTGALVGSSVGQMVYAGAKKVCRAVCNIGRTVSRAVSSVMSSVFNWA